MAEAVEDEVEEPVAVLVPLEVEVAVAVPVSELVPVFVDVAVLELVAELVPDEVLVAVEVAVAVAEAVPLADAVAVPVGMMHATSGDAAPAGALAEKGHTTHAACVPFDHVPVGQMAQLVVAPATAPATPAPSEPPDADQDPSAARKKASGAPT